MTREEWIKIIDERQNMYVKQLADIINQNSLRKEIFFNSPTGTGKTVMIAKLINLLNEEEYFFIITTLSRGGLNHQVESSLKSKIAKTNYYVFGVSSYTQATTLQGNEILELIPENKKLIWIRDEGHIKSNNWTTLLEKKSNKIINVSATNKEVDIQCVFTDTPLLRTPNQLYGTPQDSINKLLEIKNIHKNVPAYNPCLIVRDVNGSLLDEFVLLCKRHNLKYIDITEETVNIQELCKNDNDYDVIINKMKITEGVDIPRANVIYIGNRPSNEATVIQLIGRVRRNALLWHKDIDIFDENNKNLLEETSKTYIYYRYDNVAATSIDGELCMELSDTISLEQLLLDEVLVTNNHLSNGYKIAELETLFEPYTGILKLSHKERFVTVSNLPTLYKKTTSFSRFDGFKFKEISSDKELIQVSFDKTKYYKQNGAGKWRVTTTVSDNILYGKLKTYIEAKYSEELSLMQHQIYEAEKSDNVSFAQRKITASLTFLTEYYLKFLLFGKEFLQPFYNIAEHQFEQTQYKFSELDVILFSLSMLYKNQLNIYYGTLIGRMIPALNLDEIMELPENIKLEIVEKANKGLRVLSTRMVFENKPYSSYHLGNSKILHGVVSLLTKNKLVLLSNVGNITKNQIYKGLAYHFLSTKRYDLLIDEVIIYDFKNAKAVSIPIQEKNLTKLSYIAPLADANSSNRELVKDFSFNHLKAYYFLYGKYATLQAIECLKNTLGQSKNYIINDKKTGKKQRLTQKQILNIAMSIGDDDIIEKFLEYMQPSKDTLRIAILMNNINIAETLLSCVTPSTDTIIAAIKANNVQMVKKLALKVKIDFTVLSEALLTQNEAIISCVADKINVTKYNANETIRTQYIPLIKKLVSKITPTAYNLNVAIRTNNLEVVELVVGKMKNIPASCLDVVNDKKILNFLYKQINK